ncbi:MAG: hypothetical protein ACJA2W_003859 [Planctomycetota bacterium]|jgi:hypothetical protein
MTMKETTSKAQAELAAMRARLDELRVQGKLGRMELHDNLVEFKGKLDPSYTRAKSAITDLAASGIKESLRIAKSLEAGWKELRSTHQALLDEAAQKAAEEHTAKRHTKE